MNRFFIISAVCAALAAPAPGAEYTPETRPKSAPVVLGGRALSLPDISVAAVLDGHISDDRRDSTKDRLEFRDVEAAFQGYIYPQVRADVILALHKHRAEYKAEIHEAKASFQRLAEGLSAEVGKINVNFGRLNRLHTHYRPMIDQPPALTNFLGEEGLVGQGGAAAYLFPLPFYLQAEAAFWQIPEHKDEATGRATVTDTSGNSVEVPVYEESTEFGLADKVYTGRLKGSFAPTEKSELELGASLASGHGMHFTEHRDQAEVYGADLTFKAWPSAYARWTFQNEYLHLTRRVPEGRLQRDGLYSFLNYRWNKYWDTGARFDYAEGAFPAKSVERAWSLQAGYHFTETMRLIGQYKVRRVDGRTANEGWLQLAFGLGPHSHELE